MIFKVPQISYASTSPELSNKERFPFFSRVLPSDTLQAEAMANLVHTLNWNYIATLNEEGNLGGIDSFISNAKSKSIYSIYFIFLKTENIIRYMYIWILYVVSNCLRR